MFRRVNDKPKSGTQPTSKDESVRKEAQFEDDMQSLGSAGNEDANIRLFEMLLQKGNNNDSNKRPRGVIEKKEELLIDQFANNEIRNDSGKKLINNDIFLNNLITNEIESEDESSESISSVSEKRPPKEYLNETLNFPEESRFEEDQKSLGGAGNEDANYRLFEILLDKGNKYGENDLHKPITEKEVPLIDLLDNGEFQGEPYRPGELYSNNGKKATKDDMKKAVDVAEEIVKDEPEKRPSENDEYPPLSTYAMEEDLTAHRGRSKKNKKKSGEANIQPQGKLQGLEGTKEDARRKDAAIRRVKKVQLAKAKPGEEEAFHAEEMEKIKNYDFAAQKMDDIKKPGKFRRILSYAASGMGKLLGLALQVVSLGHFWRAKSTARFAFKRTDSWQAKKDTQTIPGWNGAKFDPNATKGEDVIADFRRVPTVWSRLTAAKAAEQNKDGTERPLDPVVSVMIDQPKSGSSQAMAGGEMGHAMIGIEYSRKSAISGRYERYKVQYGFYPAGSTSSFSPGANMLKNGSILPGQLSDDNDHAYDVSRRYPAKPAQVNAIFQASEKYAEGGYGYYDRNCLTFVKQMVVDTAHLATGGDIFKHSEIALSNFANFGLFGANAFDQNVKAGTENLLMDLSEQEDRTYQNYGNKRATGKDWINYKNSLRNGGGSYKSTFSPGETGERLRRMEGDEAGEIGSYKYNELLKDDEGDVTLGLDHIDTAITKQGENIQMIFQEVFPEEARQNLPWELTMIMSDIAGFGLPLSSLNNKVMFEFNRRNKGKAEADKLPIQDFKEQFVLTPDQLRDAREKMSANIGKLNLLLNQYLKNDKRLHQPILNMISLMNYGISYVDDIYRKSLRGGPEREKVTNIREEMTHNNIHVKANGRGAFFTPTHYESYIQIYKDPNVAVEKYLRLKELRAKKKESSWADDKVDSMTALLQMTKSTLHMEDEDDMTLAEYKELQKLERMEALAKDFDRSHNYMIEKDDYSQQDIDYAFQLHKQETKGLQATEEAQNNKSSHENYVTASGIYITIFMNKYFNDFRNTWLKDPDKGGIAEENVSNFPVVQSWLDNYLTERIKGKQQDFLMIVRGLYRSLKTNDPNQQVDEKDVLKEMGKVILEALVNRQLSEGGELVKVSGGSVSLGSAALNIVNNQNAEFTKLITNMIRVCQMEEKDKSLTRLNPAAKRKA